MPLPDAAENSRTIYSTGANPSGHAGRNQFCGQLADRAVGPPGHGIRPDRDHQTKENPWYSENAGSRRRSSLLPPSSRRRSAQPRRHPRHRRRRLSPAEHSPAVHGSGHGGTLEGSVCALPFGSHDRAEQLHRDGRGQQGGRRRPHRHFRGDRGQPAARPEPGASSGSGTAITGNPTQAGTFNFTIKATDGGLTSTLAYEITITVQGAPDQLLCDPADNGGFLVSGVCELPDAVIGLAYQGHLVTSHKAGGALSVVSGSLPAGLSLPATFTGSGDTVSGTPGTRASSPAPPSPCKAPATRASPCTRPTRSWWTRTSRWPSTRAADQPSPRGRSASPSRRTSSSAAGRGPTRGPSPPVNSRPA